MLFSDFGDAAVRIILTNLAVSIASLLALPAGVLLDARRAPVLGWSTLGLVGAAFVLALGMIWIDELEDWQRAAKTLGTAAAFAVACAGVSAATARRRSTDSLTVRRLYAAGVAGSALLATLVSSAIWREEDGETFWRGTGALAVVTVLAVLLQAVLRRLGAPSAERDFVVRISGAPDDAAVAEAIRTLERAGARIERA
ncbi:MAG: hypothetical protein ICV59_04740 [Thermoleophilia bacterium]|nr:hypothetical protein [Thermoleophilia bacterium]